MAYAGPDALRVPAKATSQKPAPWGSSGNKLLRARRPRQEAKDPTPGAASGRVRGGGARWVLSAEPFGVRCGGLHAQAELVCRAGRSGHGDGGR